MRNRIRLAELARGLGVVAGVGLAAAAPIAAPLLGQATDDAYLDPVARRLVEGAKALRDSSGPAAYTARVHERHVFELVTERRAQVLHDYRYVARMRWSRQSADVVRLDGHWSRYPRLGPPDSAFARRVVDRLPEPGGRPFRFGLRQLAALFELDSAGMAPIVGPLDPAAERFYRYRSGDTISLALPSGEVVRTVAVTAMPRRRGIRFLAALMWIEPETRRLARVAFRPAKPIGREGRFRLRDASGWNAGIDIDFGGGGAEDGAQAGADGAVAEAGSRPNAWSRILNAGFHSLMPRVEFAVSSIVVEYSLWRSKWWLPHSMTLRVHQFLVEEPSSWDWEEYPEVALRASVQAAFEIEEVRAARAEYADAPGLAQWEQLGDSVVSANDGDLLVVLPRDRAASSPDDLFLPGSWDPAFHEPGGRSAEVAADLARIEVGLGDAADGTPEAGAGPALWMFEPPLVTLRLLGYNRPEGFVAGSRLWRSFSWGRAALAASAGTRRPEPRVFLSLDSRFPTWRLRVSAYHDYRLASVPVGDAAGSGDPAWYAADGVRVWLSPARRNRQSTALSLFLERHDEYGAGEMRAGATAAWTPWWGSRSRRLRGGARLSVSGVLEDESRVRAGATATAILFPDRRVSAGVEAGAARTWGGPPRADSWLLDSSGRWYRGPVPQGLASRVVLRSRAGVQLRIMMARLSVFADWMRTYADWPAAEGLAFLSAGTGVVLPGGVRIDLARRLPVDGATAALDSNWRASVSFGTAF